MTEERLQKVLARAGVGSRRACEELIAAGHVAVDGRVITELGFRVDPAHADIRVDGKRIEPERLRYLILHKPAGYLSGSDPRANYPSWHDLVKAPERLYAVGRLDQDSEGLLLLTNDGELALHLTHPRYEHPKTYLVEVEGRPDARKIRRWQHGVMLDDGPTLPARVLLLKESPFPQKKPKTAHQGADAGAQSRPVTRRPVTSWLRFTLREGRKRQVRRMTGLLGHPALRVIRIGMGPLLLGDLRPGKWRELTTGEVRALREAAFGGPEPAAPDEERKQMLQNPSTIAIDGPSASGKSTIGGLLARELGYLYLDTGVMYRAVAAAAVRRKVPVDDEAAVTELAQRLHIDILPPTIDDGRDVTVVVDGEDVSWDIRRREIEKAVSPVSAYAGVRAAMRDQQRRLGESGRVVMVGRDIGTVVLPHADLKIYLDATLPERARRRYLERVARGEEVSFDQVQLDVKRRDDIDTTRVHAPLAAAKDAILVDTTGMSVDQVLERVQLLVDRWR